MSMGAGGGGILAGIGHLSILGVQDANMIKVVNQILEFSSRLVSVPLYHRQQRISWSLALAFGIGAPFGAIAGAWASKAWLSDLSTYRVVFGLLVGLVAALVLYEAWGMTGRPRAPGGAVRTLSFAIHRVRVRFAGEHFEFNPWVAAGGGFAISFVGSALGVGGGFLVTPFMVSVLHFPMHLAVGTSLVALVIPLVASVGTYLALDVKTDWLLVAVEVPGILAGSFLGPLLNQYMDERALKTFVAVLLLAIGLYYVAF